MSDERRERAARGRLADEGPRSLPQGVAATLHAAARVLNAFSPRSRRLPGAIAAVAIVAVVVAIWLPGRPPAPAAPLPSATAGQTPSPTVSASPSPGLPIGQEVDRFWLIYPGLGWAISAGHLYRTTDAFAQWEDRGPIPPTWNALTFADPDHGWAVPADGKAVERTTDGGRSWDAVAIPSDADHFGSFSFIDPLHGYLLMSDHGSRPGTLLRTDDGGGSWDVVATVPINLVGGLRFLDAESGWATGTAEPYPATGGPNLDALFATHDGGRSWQRVQLPRPAGYETAEFPDVSRAPLITGPASAILVVGYGNPVQGVTDLLATDDAGRTWHRSATLVGENPFLPIVAFDALHLLAAQDGSDPWFATSSDGGRSWSPLATSGLPPTGRVRQLAFADRAHGWALLDSSTPDQPGLMNVPGHLYATIDGGLSWTLVFGPSPTATPTPSPGP
jgi:photosystem II stability/assembly factor-like uncharacterized protein